MPALPKSSAATSHQVLNHWKSHGTDYNWQLWSEDLTDWSRYLGNRGWMWGGSNEAQSIATIRSAVRWKDAAIYRDSRPARIRQEIEDSLRRLRTDVIDLYQAHWPDLETSVWETARTLEDLRRQGKIRAIGVSNFGRPDGCFRYRSQARRRGGGPRLSERRLYHLWRAFDQLGSSLCYVIG